jgi:regulator of RNase E activity RraA
MAGTACAAVHLGAAATAAGWVGAVISGAARSAAAAASRDLEALGIAPYSCTIATHSSAVAYAT